MRQWVLSFPYGLRFLFATRPAVMSKVLGIVYRAISMHLIHKAGHTRKSADTGAVTLIQLFSSALSLNVHFHLLVLDGVYAKDGDGVRFKQVKAPTNEELAALVYGISERVGRYLLREGLLVQDVEKSYLDLETVEAGAMDDLIGSSITYRIAVGANQGRKAFSVQRLPAREELSPASTRVAKAAGFSLHAGVAALGHEREKLERLCRYITRPALSIQRLSLSSQGDVVYQLKRPYRDGTTEVVFEPLDFTAPARPKEVPLGCIHAPAALVHPCTS
jgi:hypothetical protein